MTDTAGDQSHAQALLKASRAISSSLDLDETLRLIVREAAAISEAPAVRLFLLDDSGRTLQYRVVTGIPSEEEEGLTIPVGESFSGQVVVTGQPLLVPDTRLDSRFIYPMHATNYRLVSYLGLPVKKGNRPFGVLVFNTTAPRIYTESEVSYQCVRRTGGHRHRKRSTALDFLATRSATGDPHRSDACTDDGHGRSAGDRRGDPGCDPESLPGNGEPALGAAPGFGRAVLHGDARRAGGYRGIPALSGAR
jgi:hypothetical protein